MTHLPDAPDAPVRLLAVRDHDGGRPVTSPDEWAGAC